MLLTQHEPPASDPVPALAWQGCAKVKASPSPCDGR